MANTQKVMTLADTAKLIAKVHANAAKGVRFEYDGTKGEYGNIAAYFAAHKDGKVYGVRFPKYTYSNTPTGVKTRDNANLTIEISTNAKAGRDDYAPLNAFRTWDVNATVDDDGVPHVTAIDGIDTRFKRDGSNGDVYVMTCPDTTSSKARAPTTNSVQRHPVRRLRAIARRAAARRQQTAMPVVREIRRLLDSQQRPLSVSGKEIDREFGSQNRAIDYALKKGKGYAGRCAGDTFYVQLMLMLKYATKNSDVLGGCWQYTPQTAVTKAETGVKRVIIATSYANNFDVGSTVNVGTDKERNNTGNYSAARARTILSKTAIDASNTALNLDGDAITTTTACFVNSMPWKTGATDKLPAPTAAHPPRPPPTTNPSAYRASNCSTASTKATPTSSPTPSRTTTTSAASNSTACSTSPRHPRPRRRTTPRSANSPHATRPRTTHGATPRTSPCPTASSSPRA
ncbi:MAG: hypothetical protein ACLS6O_00290 [Bifidobacterium sp.]